MTAHPFGVFPHYRQSQAGSRIPFLREAGRSGQVNNYALRLTKICNASLELGWNSQPIELNMQTSIEESPVVRKTKELCETILEQPNMRSIRQRVNAFMGDASARAQYDGLISKGQALQQKQQAAMPLTGEEIADFEHHRDQLLSNPIARGYLDAQDELHEVQKSVHNYVSKTLELGRMPTEADLGEGSCGHGCGCH